MYISNLSPLLNPIRSVVKINGVPRPECVCLSFSASSGDDYGVAHLDFPRGGYDAELCRENDLVEISIYPRGIVWRGFITSRNTNETERLTYTALDLAAKLKTTFFADVYNYIDPVTKVRMNQATVRDIARAASVIYEAWRIGYQPNDYVLTFDLGTFPTVNPGEFALRGQPLADGLAEVLKHVDSRYQIRVIHDNNGSYVQCFRLGTGAIKSVVRGTDPTLPPANQPQGYATVFELTRTVNTSDVVSHLWCEGDNRLIEYSFNLSANWTPSGVMIPSGILDNYERYTCDSLKYGSGELRNPDYRKEYEDVARRYSIGAINDIWMPSGSSNIYGQYGRHPELESGIVQTFKGEPLNHFVIVRASGLPYQVIDDGYSIEDNNRNIRFHDPLRREIKHTIWQDYFGGVTWDDLYDEPTNTTRVYSQTLALAAQGQFPDIVASGTTFNQLLTTGCNYWFVPGEYTLGYPVLTWDEKSVLVQGNLTLDQDEPSGYPSNTSLTSETKLLDFIITDKSPFIASGASGVGYMGRYDIGSNANRATNQYVGNYLVLGDGPVKDLSVNEIVRSEGNYVYVKDIDKDLSTQSPNWQINSINHSHYELWNEVYLNAAFKSHERLTYVTPNIATTRNKRVQYYETNDYKWETQAGWTLYEYTGSMPSGIMPADVLPSVIAALPSGALIPYMPSGIVDKRCEYDGLVEWGRQKLEGNNTVEKSVDVRLPMSFSFNVGDQISINGLNEGLSIISLEHDLLAFTTSISARSKS